MTDTNIISKARRDIHYQTTYSKRYDDFVNRTRSAKRQLELPLEGFAQCSTGEEND